MPETYEIRADYNADTIVVYQAYSSTIADAALENGTFVEPFSFYRMTWIKPSFLWLMERSNWGRKSGQERILAVQIQRAGWDKALSLGVLTHPEPAIHGSHTQWQAEFDAAVVHIQWDPERSLRGQALNHYSIQVGLSRHIIERYVNEWVISIEDKTPTVRKMYDLISQGKADKARDFLPKERVYPIEAETMRRLGMRKGNG